MSEYYTLVGQTPVPAELLEWAAWFEVPGNRSVKLTRLLDMVEVSTVFMGLDHRMVGSGPPILFESMAFWGPERDGYEQDRCSTWLQAEQMHQEMCRDVMRPSSVLAFCRRMLRDWWSEAREDWRRGWKELRGIPRSEWEVLSDQLRDMKAGRLNG
jgi:hypothetical protein